MNASGFSLIYKRSWVKESETHRGRELCQPQSSQTAVGFDTKQGDGVTVLIAHQNVLTGGIDSEIPGSLSSAGDSVQEMQASVGFNPITAQTIMAPVGSIQVLAVRGDVQIRTDVAGLVYILRQGFHTAKQCHFTMIAGKVRNLAADLIDQIEEFIVMAKYAASGTAAGRNRKVILRSGSNHAVLIAVSLYRINAQIGNIH